MAIIGQGRSGRDIHAFSLSKMPEHFEIAAVADEMEERRKMAERDFGTAAYSDYLELFQRSDLDLIILEVRRQIAIMEQCFSQNPVFGAIG